MAAGKERLAKWLVTINPDMAKDLGAWEQRPTAAMLKSIVITPAQVRLVAGQQQPFDATGEFSDQTSGENLTYDVEWSSSDTDVLEIDSRTGLAKAKQPMQGTTTVTITAKHADSAVNP